MTRTVTAISGHPRGTGTDILGSVRIAYREVNITSYTNPGGEALTATDMGLTSMFAAFALPMEGATAANRRLGVWDPTNDKLLIVGDKGTATAGGEFEEAADTTDVGTFLVIGFGT